LLLIAFLFSVGIYSQNVTGIVTSDDGPLPGATLLVKGTNNFATTDFDGNFTIEASQGDVLVVSFVGYTTQEVTVNADQLTISLALGNLLDEVIVTTGYGTQSKRDITGAVSTIDAEDLTSVPATTFPQQMQGRASGISVVSDATPGGEATVRIRGFGTTGNNNPLYIIDGVPSQTQGNLNPQDIESLQILKDASAASIYGSRAANGVIIITTKKGKVGEPRISYSTFYGWQKAANDVDALDARGLGEYLYLADYYAGNDFGGPPFEGNFDGLLGGNLKIEKKVPFISSAEESGFYVYGDVKDLKTITLQNGKKVILVAQNGANLKVFEKTN